MLQLLIEGYVLGVAVSLPVGPVGIAMMRRALQYGFWNATLFGSGSIGADLLYISLVYLGVAPLLAEWPWLRVALWLLGAGWLGWMGIDALRSALQPVVETEAAISGGGHARSFVAGVGITLLNPLTIVSWLSLGGGYFALHPLARTPAGGLLAIVAIVSGLLTYVVIVSGLLATGRRWLRPGFVRALSGLAGSILLLVALHFLVSAVQSILGVQAV